jgi:anti-sigma factor RsiW
MKRRIAEAGAKYPVPAALEQSVRGKIPAPAAPNRGRWGLGLVAAAAVLAVGVVSVPIERARVQEAALMGQVVDQHIATLASGSPPGVVSSDRHTVKPWFQGKLPFSFNLPSDLPADMVLDGANLQYVGGQPVAQLLFRIGQHRASVFVEQREGSIGVKDGERAGFHVRGFQSAELQGQAVSDVEPASLAELVRLVAKAQGDGAK